MGEYIKSCFFLILLSLSLNFLHSNEISFKEHMIIIENEEEEISNAFGSGLNEGSESLYTHFILDLLDQGTLLKLDDGSVWIIPTQTFHMGSLVELPFRERLMKWDLRHPLKIVKYDLSKEITFALYNPQASEGERFVGIQPLEPPNNPSKGLCILDIQEGRSITLSDASQWSVNWYNSFWTKSWKIGHALMPAYMNAKDSSPTILINLDLAEVPWITVKLRIE